MPSCLILTKLSTLLFYYHSSESRSLSELSHLHSLSDRYSKNEFPISGNIDAGFTWKNGKTYLFSKDQYWRFTNKNRDSGYPKPISKGFAGIPNFIDAAFVWSGNGLIYFFKNGDYYRYDHEKLGDFRNISILFTIHILIGNCK